MIKQAMLTSISVCSVGAFASGYFPITIENNSKLMANNTVYIAIKASQDGHDCMMRIDDNGMARCEMVNSDTNLSIYNYALSSVKTPIQLPRSESGRIYVSLGYPIQMHVDEKTNKIVDPDGFNPRDSNYYTLYDKVEYTFTQNGTWINPTAVDFFAIPLHISQPGASSKVTEAGLSASRQTVINQVTDQFHQFDRTQHHVWDNLKLTYQGTLLRLMAPAKAMVSIPDQKPFPNNYLQEKNETHYNYIDALWDYYRTATITIDCSELASKIKLNDYQFTGKVEGGHFVFKNKDGSSTVTLTKPDDSRPFFAGAVGSFDAENNTPKAIIIRELTAAFDVGLLPAENGAVLNKIYFNDAKSSYYTNNQWVPSDSGPWFDLYAKALHSIGDNQPIYTFAYDDALGQDGTLHDANGSTPSQATIRIGDMRGSNIPNPYDDKNIYTITPVFGDGSQATYQGKPLESNQLVEGVTMPFHVTLNGKEMDIYVNPKMVLPFSKQSDGIVISATPGKSQATIIFPAIP